MPDPVISQNNFSTDIYTPIDGEPHYTQTLNDAVQKLANRTWYLKLNSASSTSISGSNIHDYGTQNVKVGTTALSSLTTGSNNTAIGYNSLKTVTDQTGNTAVGNDSLKLNTASFNTSFGNSALANNTDGSGNTANGSTSLRNNTTGYNNTAFGSNSLYNNISGGGNVAIGYCAGYYETEYNKLYIANSAGTSGDALIYGEFDTRFVQVNGDLRITGKLTVDGLIDPTGLELTPVSVNPGLVPTNTLWLNSSDGNRLYVGSNPISGSGGVDLSAYTLLSTTEGISGDFDIRLDTAESRLDTAESRLDTAESRLDAISGSVIGLDTDINNLDVSFTEKIAVECLTSNAISGAASTVTGYLKIYLNGVEYKLGIVS